MALPTTGIKAGEVRVDPANWNEYRFVAWGWMLNTPEVLEPLAVSLVTINGVLPDGTEINEIRQEPETGVSFKWSGSEWVLQSEIAVASNIATGAVDSAAIEDGSVVSDDLAPGVLKVVTVNVSHADIMAGFSYSKEIVPAPGAGYYVSPESIDVNYLAGSGPYQWYDEMMMTPTPIQSFVALWANAMAQTGLSGNVFQKHQSYGYMYPNTGMYWGTNMTPDPMYCPPAETGGSIKITVAYRVLSV